MAEGQEAPLAIIAVDGSENSVKAFNWYCDVIHKPEHRILLVHSAEYPHIGASRKFCQLGAISDKEAMYMSGDLWDQMMAQEKHRVTELEQKYSDLMKARGLSGKIKAVFGAKPGEVIVDIANEEKATVVIMGTRGLNTLRRTLLGSVSDYVLHHAHCPVLICRH